MPKINPANPKNHLHRETSPYLLQHANNPVNWHPWSDAAFAKAKAQDKPIFVSIGYSTCYWCHVMEKESFENEAVAAVLNKYFIAIKVDREERPDVDEQFMIATQMLTGRGGWPNSVWLTPDGRPWMAGTYFPREHFIKLLTTLADVWAKQRDKAEEQATQMAEGIRRGSETERFRSDQPVNQEMVSRAVSVLGYRFDPEQGGFGGAPKFPPHGTLRLLLHDYRRTKSDELKTMITRTLDAMVAGGIRDHIGGGFHRYATDGRWFLPHFEKMLTDNAQLLRIYAEAFALFGNAEYRAVAAEIAEWVQWEMTDETGGFYTALDAGEVGEEGEFYVWSYDELAKVLGGANAAKFAAVYGCKKEGNFEEEASGKATGLNVLSLVVPAYEAVDKMRASLLVARNLRTRPHCDDKILTSANGLMIGALAYAGRQFKEPKYTQAAAKAATFVLAKLRTRDGKLLRSYRAGRAHGAGYLDDYAFLIEGLLELHAADENPEWLASAQGLGKGMIAEFEDKRGGGFFYVTAEHDNLLMRSKNLLGGGNLPSGNGVAASVLLRLGNLTGRKEYTEAALGTLDSLSGLLWQSGYGSEALLLAAAESLPHRATKKSPHSPDVKLTQGVVDVELFASRLTVRPGEEFYVAASLEIAKGYHLYGLNPSMDFVQPVEISLTRNAAISAGAVTFPPAQTRTDPTLNKPVAVYHGRAVFLIPLRVAPSAKAGDIALAWTIQMQACSETQCLAPQTATLSLTVTVDPDAPATTRHDAMFTPLLAPARK